MKEHNSKKQMREIKWLTVHCTATGTSATVEGMKNYWRDHLGWKSPGYHKVINRDGTIETLLPDDKISNGVGGGYNTNSLNVSYIGGITKEGKAIDNRTDEQKEALETVLKEWRVKYPKAIILGHRDFYLIYKYKLANKACPCFSSIEEYAHI